MAIVRVELEDAAERRLIRVTTVDDVTARAPVGPGAPFADSDAALAYLRGWLERWLEEP
jgi:hypothetical protein